MKTTIKETVKVAVSDRIQAEALRTIEGMQRFYEKYSDDIDDAEELEHRIARVEASKEGCNGLTPEDKLQKTAENVFELTCAQERSYDALRMELWKTRQEWKGAFEELKKMHSNDYKSLHVELKNGLEAVVKKIEDSGTDSSASMQKPKQQNNKFLSKIITEHPLLAFSTFIFMLILVFISGHFEILAKLCGGK